MESRYEMDSSKQGQYTLVIPKVDRGHAGEYRCDDDEGSTKGRAMQLVVIGEQFVYCDDSIENLFFIICSKWKQDKKFFTKLILYIYR